MPFALFAGSTTRGDPRLVHFNFFFKKKDFKNPKNVLGDNHALRKNEKLENEYTSRENKKKR